MDTTDPNTGSIVADGSITSPGTAEPVTSVSTGKPIDEIVVAIAAEIEEWRPVLADLKKMDDDAKAAGHSLVSMLVKVGQSFFGIFR